MSYVYYKENNAEFCYEPDHDKLFVKNKKGQLFLLNKDADWAEKRSRDVFYTTTDGKCVIRASDTEHRRINKKIRKERKDAEFMASMVAAGWLRTLKLVTCDTRAVLDGPQT